MPQFAAYPTRVATAALVLASCLAAGCGRGGHPVLAPATAARATMARAQSVVSGPLTLLTMPEDGITPLLDGMRAATKSIKIKVYMLTNHDETETLVQTLIDRAHAGIDVEVVLEVRPYIPPDAPDCKPNTESPNQPAIDRLLAGGVRVRYANPRFKYTHEKTMVVDDATAYVMTCNLTNSAFTANREYVVIDHTPADVAELLRCFAADWDAVPFVPASGPLVFSPENSRQKLLALIDSSTTTLTVQVEYMTDPEVIAHVAARVKAGVDVKVMLAYLPPPACPGGQDTNALEAQELNAAGITQIQFSKTLKMHAKCTIADEARAFVGSENYTTNSLNGNREVGLMLGDPLLVNKLVSVAAGDWGQGAQTAPTGGQP